jgi:hypothetical protein
LKRREDGLRSPFVFSDFIPILIVQVIGIVSNENLGTFFVLPGLSTRLFFSLLVSSFGEDKVNAFLDQVTTPK